MSPSSRPHGQPSRARTAVNNAIRRLIDQPPSPERTARYERLLARWRDLVDEDVTPAT